MYQLPFYPKHEDGCPHVKSCPHLGGASLGTLVLAARDHGETFWALQRQLDAEPERNDRLFAENQRLETKVEQLQLELRLERQNRFATNKQKEATDQADESAATPPKKKGKRGAPKGHTGWYRKTPTQYDVRIDVPVPKRCPHCQSANISVFTSQPQSEHLQEDIIDVIRIVLELPLEYAYCTFPCQPAASDLAPDFTDAKPNKKTRKDQKSF